MSHSNRSHPESYFFSNNYAKVMPVDLWLRHFQPHPDVAGSNFQRFLFIYNAAHLGVYAAPLSTSKVTNYIMSQLEKRLHVVTNPI